MASPGQFFVFLRALGRYSRKSYILYIYIIYIILIFEIIVVFTIFSNIKILRLSVSAILEIFKMRISVTFLLKL